MPLCAERRPRDDGAMPPMSRDAQLRVTPADSPALLDAAEAEELRLAAERIGFLYHELAEIVLDSPALLDDFFRLTPWQKAMWLASGGSWHGIARVDLKQSQQFGKNISTNTTKLAVLE